MTFDDRQFGTFGLRHFLVNIGAALLFPFLFVGPRFFSGIYFNDRILFFEAVAVPDQHLIFQGLTRVLCLSSNTVSNPYHFIHLPDCQQ